MFHNFREQSQQTTTFDIHLSATIMSTSQASSTTTGSYNDTAITSTNFPQSSYVTREVYPSPQFDNIKHYFQIVGLLIGSHIAPIMHAYHEWCCEAVDLDRNAKVPFVQCDVDWSLLAASGSSPTRLFSTVCCTINLNELARSINSRMQHKLLLCPYTR